jgi:hypothetical protein
MKEVSLNPQSMAEIEAAERKLTTIRRHLGAASLRDESASPGQSLRNPFLNERAMKYWDADSIDRWMMRHDFKLPVRDGE